MLEFTLRLAPVEELLGMVSVVLRILVKSIVSFFFLAIACFSLAFAQSPTAAKYKSQEMSETDGVPVLMKHLPDWERVRDRAVFATNAADLKASLGERSILGLIDFSAGTEVATAPFDAGRLVIIEYSSPQGSVDADVKFTANLVNDQQTASTVYRRIGNYNVFVFDATNKAGANALIDQVKYEKQVQWLGANPFRISAERAFVLTTTDMFISTFLIVLIGMGLSIGGGIIAGYVFFYVRDQKRASMPTFSDAAGMTRLNLDGLTPDIASDRLLND